MTKRWWAIAAAIGLLAAGCGTVGGSPPASTSPSPVVCGGFFHCHPNDPPSCLKDEPASCSNAPPSPNP